MKISMRYLRNTSRLTITLMWFPVALFYLECALKVDCFHSLFDKGFLYTALFSLSGGLFCALLATLWGKKGNFAVSIGILSLATLWCMVQTVYYKIFTTFLTIYSVGSAGGEVLQFWEVMIDGIRSAWLPLLLELIPLVLLCVLGRRFIPVRRARARMLALMGAGSVAVYMIALVVVMTAAGGVMLPRYL